MKLHPQKPPRFKEGNSFYFLTFCTFKRKQLLHNETIPQFLIEELQFYKQKVKDLIAYTIMPDHIHLIVEVEKVEEMSAFLRDFKKYTSKGIKRMLCGNGSPTRICDGQSTPISDRLLREPIWQPGTMDHCIRMNWENKDFENHLSYLFYNSYKHLNIPPKDFQHHNFTEFVAQGVFDNDFLAMDESTTKTFEIYE